MCDKKNEIYIYNVKKMTCLGVLDNKKTRRCQWNRFEEERRNKNWKLHPYTRCTRSPFAWLYVPLRAIQFFVCASINIPTILLCGQIATSWRSSSNSVVKLKAFNIKDHVFQQWERRLGSGHFTTNLIQAWLIAIHSIFEDDEDVEDVVFFFPKDRGVVVETSKERSSMPLSVTAMEACEIIANRCGTHNDNTYSGWSMLGNCCVTSKDLFQKSKIDAYI